MGPATPAAESPAVQAARRRARRTALWLALAVLAVYGGFMLAGALQR